MIQEGNLRLCDGGMERLIVEWIYRRQWWLARSKGLDTTALTRKQEYANLFGKAGLPDFAPPRPLQVFEPHEWRLYMRELAPNEANGEADREPWNLFDELIAPDGRLGALIEDRHHLSGMVRRWEKASVSTVPFHFLVLQHPFMTSAIRRIQSFLAVL